MFKSLFGGDFVEEKADLNHSISSNLNTTQNNKHVDLNKNPVKKPEEI